MARGLVHASRTSHRSREADPLGYILFKRNVDTPAQVRACVTEEMSSRYGSYFIA